MYKFIKQYAETMKDASIYPMISLFIFLIFFIVLLVLVKKMGKERVTELSNIPFEEDELTQSNVIN
jgi:cytochrome c oxidase cbb3-type subunit IV